MTAIPSTCTDGRLAENSERGEIIANLCKHAINNGQTLATVLRQKAGQPASGRCGTALGRDPRLAFVMREREKVSTSGQIPNSSGRRHRLMEERA